MSPSKYTLIASAITFSLGFIYAIKPDKAGPSFQACIRTLFNFILFLGTNPAFTTVATTKIAVLGTAGGSVVTLRTSCNSVNAKTIYIK